MEESWGLRPGGGDASPSCYTVLAAYFMSSPLIAFTDRILRAARILLIIRPIYQVIIQHLDVLPVIIGPDKVNSGLIIQGPDGKYIDPSY
jgi:hypothetical protein